MEEQDYVIQPRQANGMLSGEQELCSANDRQLITLKPRLRYRLTFRAAQYRLMCSTGR